MPFQIKYQCSTRTQPNDACNWDIGCPLASYMTMVMFTYHLKMQFIYSAPTVGSSYNSK